MRLISRWTMVVASRTTGDVNVYSFRSAFFFYSFEFLAKCNHKIDLISEVNR